jgi:hypothetical protein
LAWITIVVGGGTRTHYVGKLFGAVIVATAAFLWHAFQELSFWWFASGVSPVPPLIGNYAPQSTAYEMTLDAIAITWGFVTAIALGVPGIYNLEEESPDTAAMIMEADGPGAKQRHMSTFMRAGFAALTAWVFYPLVILFLGPILLTIFFTPVVGDVGIATAGFRLDILFWMLTSMVFAGAFWIAVYFYHWRYGVYQLHVTKPDALKYRRRVVAMGILHELVILVAGFLCMFPFMSGLEFLQPAFAFAGAFLLTGIAAFFVAFIVNPTKDKKVRYETLRDKLRAKQKRT